MENEKLNEMLKSIWDNLTDEQKEKARACRTAEELTALAASEGIELPDEMLDAASGGIIMKIDGTWSVFFDDGEYIENVKTKQEAFYVADLYSVSKNEVDTPTLLKIWKENESRC